MSDYMKSDQNLGQCRYSPQKGGSTKGMGQIRAGMHCKPESATRTQRVVKVSTGLNGQSRAQQVAKNSMYGQSIFWYFGTKNDVFWICQYSPTMFGELCFKADPNMLPKHTHCRQIMFCVVFVVFWPIFEPYLRNLNFCIIFRPGFDPYSPRRDK